MNLEELLAYGPWRLETPEAAVFRLAPETTDRRGILVERLLGAPEPDPDLWESVLIEAFLIHPSTAGLLALRLERTEPAPIVSRFSHLALTSAA